MTYTICINSLKDIFLTENEKTLAPKDQRMYQFLKGYISNLFPVGILPGHWLTYQFLKGYISNSFTTVAASLPGGYQFLKGYISNLINFKYCFSNSFLYQFLKGYISNNMYRHLGR